MAKKIIIICFLIFTVASYVRVNGIKVCPTFNDYYTVLFNKNCFENPDYDGNPEAIVNRWGLNFSQYNITTNDGFVLSIFRISGNTTNQTPVVIGHGIVLNALCFMATGNKSLAYLVSKAGYDVWLINFRGTRFSRGHKNLTQSDSKYWNSIGLQNMATQDLSAVVNFVYNTTKQKVTYIGYSMGTTISFIYSSLQKQQATGMLKNIISLAPVAHFEHSTSALIPLAPTYPAAKIFLKTIWPNEMLPYSDNAGKQCYPLPPQIDACELVVKPVFGSISEIDPITYPITSHLNSDSVSYNVVGHYAQIITSKRFQQYDYGASGNIKHYGVPEPPLYNISEVAVPTTFFVGKSDIIATVQDVTNLYNQLSEPARCGFNLLEPENFGHRDFVSNNDVVNILYKNVLNSLQQTGKC